MSERRPDRCELCRFFEPSTLMKPPATGGTCHRYAPRNGTSDWRIWPEIGGLDWCGEFVARPTGPVYLPAPETLGPSRPAEP